MEGSDPSDESLGYFRSSAARTPKSRTRKPWFGSPKTQNPVTFCRAKTTGGNGISGNSRGGLNTFRGRS